MLFKQGDTFYCYYSQDGSVEQVGCFTFFGIHKITRHETGNITIKIMVKADYGSVMSKQILKTFASPAVKEWARKLNEYINQ